MTDERVSKWANLLGGLWENFLGARHAMLGMFDNNSRHVYQFVS